ncbi:MAG: hypothetical protein ACNA8L_02405 [Luteolibacter sp.]
MLPEQKKSPEEIHALRGKLGIAGVVLQDEADTTPVATLSPERVKEDEAGSKPLIDPATGLPVHRRSNDELERIRLRALLETQHNTQPRPARRERAMVVLSGYLFALSAVIPVYHNLPMILPLGIALVSLAFGAYLFFLRPYSKHHGPFIGIVVLFVLTYAALQYFPQLRHAT